MAQSLYEVNLKLKSGKIQKANAVGNNAAWLCTCGNTLPLIGRSIFPDKITIDSQVLCNCNKSYYVVSKTFQGKVAIIVEIDRIYENEKEIQISDLGIDSYLL